MMLLNNNHDNLHFAFMIPHVSKLLIYKDNWNKSQVMRQVIEEILHTGLFIKLSLGNQYINYCNEFDPSCNDCAIINISISGMDNLNYTPKTAEDFFAKEIGDTTNVLNFNNTKLSIEKNVSCIEISIRIAHTSAPAKDDVQAA
jgi:hypothetical protein